MNKLDIYNLYLLDFAYVFNKSRQRLSDVYLSKLRRNSSGSDF